MLLPPVKRSTDSAARRKAKSEIKFILNEALKLALGRQA